MAPSVLLLAVLVAVPLGRVLWYSFTEYDGLAAPVFVGLDNYRFLWDWPDARRTVLNTVLLACGVVVWVAVPFVLALIIFGRRRADSFRAVLFVPAMLPPIVVGGVFRLLLAEAGPLQTLFDRVGLGALSPPWLSGDPFVIVTVVLVITWAVMGSGILFYSAGLAALPRDYLDAALVDGANWTQLAWHIYRPALRPVTRFWTLLLIVSTVTGFFPWIHGLTRGGPGIASTTMDYQVYLAGIRSSRLGLGSALAVLGIVVIAALVAGVAAVARVRERRLG